MITFSKKTTAVSFVVILMVLLAVVGIIFIPKYVEKSKYAFVIDGKKFTKTEIKDLVSFPNRINPSANNVKSAYNYYKDEAVAQKLGITVPQSAIDSEVSRLAIFLKADTSAQAQNWLKLLAFDNVLKRLIVSSGTGSVKGYVYFFWGNQHVSAFYLSGNPPAGSDNPVNIEKDKNYALQKANYFHDALINGQITPDEALAKITEDINLNQAFVPNSNFSMKVGDGEISWDTQLQNSDIIAYIKSITKKGVSEVQKADLVNYGKNMGTYYYFVDLTQTYAKPVNQASFDNDLKTMKATYYGL
jgi:hypothetical protein